MKLNDCMRVSDLQLLSEHQYNSLMNYLRFLGIKSAISYNQMQTTQADSIVLTVYEREAHVSLVWTSVNDSALAAKHCFTDIIRMTEMGEMMTYENR